MSTSLALLFVTMTNAFQLPSGMLSAVCYTESRHNPKAVNVNDGGSASLGTCQVKLATARMLGFKGTANQLQSPEVNVYYAAMLLRHNLNRYYGDSTKAISAYNMGSHKLNKQGLTINRNYVQQVQQAWEAGK